MSRYDFLLATFALPSAHDPGWPYARNKDTGYGVLLHDGRTRTVHQIVCEIAHGPRPEGQVTRHRCRNRACYWPGHLKWGTAQDNSDDMVEDKTVAWGELGGNAKLTDAQAIDIVARYIPYKMTCQQLADEYDVAVVTVWRVTQGYTFSHVTGLPYRSLPQNHPKR